jgi:hypothetical protein
MTAKPSLRERIAALKTTKEAAPVSKFSAKEAKTRVAASWTIAKTLLPAAPSEVQYKLASSLLANSTNALTAMLRQAAVNAHNTKLAEKLEEMHKVELNELIEDPSLLNKMKNEVEKELKGEAKNASGKCECGKPGCPECNPKTAKAKCECGKPGCPECNPKTAKAKKAEGENEPIKDVSEEEIKETDTEDVPAPPVGEPSMEEELPAEADAAPASPEEAKKEVIQEQIENLKEDVAALEAEVVDGEELDFSSIFDEEGMADNVDNLANEDADGDFDGDIEASGDDFFGPSSASELEGALDTEGMEFADASDFFSHKGATSSMDDLFVSEKHATKEETFAPGEMGDKIVSKGNVADAEEDHEDDILLDVLNGIKDVNFDLAEYKRDTEPKFEKAASKKAAAPLAVKRPIRSLGNVKQASPERVKEAAMLASLVFPDDETFG